MTPEEIQRTLEQMLGVQREIQESQLKFQDNLLRVEQNQSRLQDNLLRLEQSQSRLTEDISQLTENISELTESSRRQDRRIEQLIGYSITGESERLNLEQRVRILEQKMPEIGRPRKLRRQKWN